MSLSSPTDRKATTSPVGTNLPKEFSATQDIIYKLGIKKPVIQPKNKEKIVKEEIKKKRKVYDHIIPFKENILEQQEQLQHVKVECFTKIQKMEDRIKALKRHLGNAS